MPLLGEWTFNNFCMSMSQQARTAKEDFLELKNSFEGQKCTLKKQQSIIEENQESLQLLQHIITNQHKTIIEINERLKHLDNNNHRSVDSNDANSSNEFAYDPIFNVTPTQSPTNSSSDSNNEMDQFPSPKKVSVF